MTTNSPNPVDGDVQALIGLCKIEIKRLKAASETNPNMRYMATLMETALAALTAEPDVLISEEGGQAIRAIINREISGAGRYVIFERPTFTGGEKMMPLYTTPPAQILRPVELPEFKVHSNQPCWPSLTVGLRDKEWIEALRDQGYEVKS